MAKTFQYSYQFGYDVVEKFTEKYARGTKFLAQMCDISIIDMKARLIQAVRTGNQVNWEADKLLVKHSQSENFVEYKSLPVEKRRKYLTYVKYGAQDRVLDAKEKHLLSSRDQNLLL